jgi:hypothetical protein
MILLRRKATVETIRRLGVGVLPYASQGSAVANRLSGAGRIATLAYDFRLHLILTDGGGR